MGLDGIEYQPGDIISYDIQNNYWGKALSLKHYGVVIDGGYVISKYEENGGQLEKQKIETGNVKKITLLKKGGRKCADHAIARYNKGRINSAGHREDICPYSAISANCQHFANDCFIQEDNASYSEDKIKVVGIAGLVGALALATVMASSNTDTDQKRNNRLYA